jgi:K+-transporting ATPase ATPase C chain
MLRRQLLTAVIMMIAFTILVGFAYPLVVTAVAQIGFHRQANDSLIKQGGKIIGSSLLAQGFLDKNGNPLPQYFQPRPSAAGSGYDASSSSASNLGPSNPNLIGNVPGVSISDTTNAYATPTDPYCVPVQATDNNNNPVTDAQGNPVYQKNTDGTYVCNSNTVPERAIAYRQLNGLPDNAEVPVDAVTASGSGLDPDISFANAQLQAPRVAKARGLSVDRVVALIHTHVNQPAFGFLGEKTVNVLDLNLALDALHT